ncbi:MAG: aldose 1-epimerase [Bacteroidetes bacterium]|nr:aldose 1-epimerase [Bacteroidota bacterium]
MYNIETTTESGLTRIIIKNSQTDEYLSIVPRYGGNINDMVLQKNGKLYPIIAGYKTVDEFEKHEYYRNSKLLPFTNRLKNGNYSFEGKNYQLPINEEDLNNTLHGFFYKREFEIAEREVCEEYGKLILKTLYNSELEGYPFKFSAELSYEFSSENGLILTTKIVNKCEELIPIGDGWHPYFTFGGKVDDLFLKVPKGVVNLLDSQNIPTGNQMPCERFIKSEKIEDYLLDTGLSLETDNDALTEIYNPEENVTIILWQKTGHRLYNYLQVFIPPDRMSIAVEPMTCNANALNNKDGLIILSPGEKITTVCGIQLK